MASNGRLLAVELSPIPQGELANEAAAAWNAGPAKAGLLPTGPASSYRSLSEQEYFWRLWQEGRGNLAAYPGTSNHGWGLAVDLREEWMRSWIDDHGAKFGWRKTEAPSEWWHVNYDGSKHFPTFKALTKGDKSKRVRWYTKRLRFIHPQGDGRGYFPHKPRRKFDADVRQAVVAFQRDHGLHPDGVIGEHTAHKISEIFHKQYIHRNKRRRLVREDGRLKIKIGGRKRKFVDAVRGRP
jgi:hypothetical protein